MVFGMKSIKSFMVGLICFVIVPLTGMISQKSQSRRNRASQLVQQAQPARYKSNIVWVRTSDNVIMEIPRWQIDQMKDLQQKEDNSNDNPINALMITGENLALVCKALTIASNLEQFRRFYSGLSDDQQKSLLADAFTLGMQGLASLLITYMFPVEVQQQMGASIIQQGGIIAPLVQYLQKPEIIPLGHKGMVRSVAFSPDGNRIISAAAGVERNLILYDLKSGKEIKNLIPQTFPEPCVAFSPDGKYIAAGASRYFDTLIVSDGITGERIKVLGGSEQVDIFGRYESKIVNCVAFSSDSNSILAGAQFPYLGFKPIVYDVKTGKIILVYDNSSVFYDKSKKDSFEGYNDSMTCAAFRPNRNDIIVGSDGSGSNLSAYDSKTYKYIRSFTGLSQGSPSIMFSLDGKYLVGGTLELLLWDAETGKTVKTFQNLGGRIVSVAFHPSGNYIVAGYNRSQNNVIMFSCKTGLPIRKFDGISDVQCVAFSPDGHLLLCGGRQGLMLFKLINKKALNTIATKLNLAQARLLYRLYLAKINKLPVIMDSKDLDYQLFNTLPDDVRQLVKTFLPFELFGDITEKEIQEKMNKYRLSLFYHDSGIWGAYEKKRDEKIKSIKETMQKLDKNSTSYKACERLLIALEQEEAFEA